MSNYFFEVLRPGINTTFQDKGRFHMQHLGVTPGGCMDLSLFSVANSLVGNSLDEGDQIDILATKQSAYGYMALEGGFDIKPFCKSVSILSRAQIGPNEGQKIKTLLEF